MKPSIYNFSFQADDGQWLLYNMLSRGLAVVTPEDYTAVNAILTGSSDSQDRPDLRQQLVAGQLLIEEHIDERKVLRVLHQQERFDTRRLHLVLFPTFGCNFSCPYCFQTQLTSIGYDFHGKMEHAVAVALSNYVRKAVPQLQRFTADWMGGEPLTALDVVLRLSHAFKSLCEDALCEYRSQVTTNGFTLSADVARKLLAAGITKAMITIDGPPELHDRRRPLKSGEGTFCAILKNVIAAADVLDGVKIRTNVDSENAFHLLPLIDILKSAGLNRENVSLVFALTSINDGCVSELCRASDNVFLDETIRASKYALEQGFRVLRPDKESTIRCWATTRGTFAITPSGDVHKCASFAGRTDSRDGFLDTQSEEVRLEYSAVEWLAWNPFEAEECRDCSFLPICLGGCPYNQLAAGSHTESVSTPSRDSLVDCQDWNRRRLEAALLHEYHKKRN